MDQVKEGPLRHLSEDEIVALTSRTASEADVQRAMLHVVECPGCGDLVRLMEEMDESVATQHHPPTVPTALQDRVMQFLRRLETGRSPGMRLTGSRLLRMSRDEIIKQARDFIVHRLACIALHPPQAERTAPRPAAELHARDPQDAAEPDGCPSLLLPFLRSRSEPALFFFHPGKAVEAIGRCPFLPRKEAAAGYANNAMVLYVAATGCTIVHENECVTFVLRGPDFARDATPLRKLVECTGQVAWPERLEISSLRALWDCLYAPQPCDEADGPMHQVVGCGAAGVRSMVWSLEERSLIVQPFTPSSRGDGKRWRWDVRLRFRHSRNVEDPPSVGEGGPTSLGALVSSACRLAGEKLNLTDMVVDFLNKPRLVVRLAVLLMYGLVDTLQMDPLQAAGNPCNAKGVSKCTCHRAVKDLGRGTEQSGERLSSLDRLRLHVARRLLAPAHLTPEAGRFVLKCPPETPLGETAAALEEELVKA